MIKKIWEASKLNALASIALAVSLFPDSSRAAIEIIEVTDSTPSAWSITSQSWDNANDGKFGIPHLNVSENAVNTLVFDIEIQIRDVGFDFGQLPQEMTIGLDKSITNNTGAHWSAVDMILGTGIGAGFTESNETDNLWFYIPASTPSFTPVDTSGKFDTVNWENDADPHADKPDTLSYSASSSSGQANGTTSDLWAAIHVPRDIDGSGIILDKTATFTIRQIVTLGTAPIPEPASALLFGLASSLLLRRRRSH
ncbi:MAG: PEP-CTERM sorting domain-containing protein [Verrucomicrobiota bacterium]